MPSYNRVVTRYENGITEVIDYEFSQEYGYTRQVNNIDKPKTNGRVKIGRIKNKKDDFKQVNVFKNCVRAQKKIRMLCNNNQSQLTKFLTLTFASPHGFSDIQLANYKFKKFCQRIDYRLKKQGLKFEYLCVPELTKVGNIHYHLLCNLPYIDVYQLQDIWGCGIIYINKIEEIENLAAYISSYVEKDFGKELPGVKHFFKSKGVKYPISEKLISNEDTNKYDFDNLIYASNNNNHYCGQVDTRIYDENSFWE